MVLILNEAYSIQIIKNSCVYIVKEFSNDMHSSYVLIDECINFKELIKIENNIFISFENSTALTMVTHLKSKELDDVFPNLMKVLRMFLNTAVANCTRGPFKF